MFAPGGDKWKRPIEDSSLSSEEGSWVLGRAYRRRTHRKRRELGSPLLRDTIALFHWGVFIPPILTWQPSSWKPFTSTARPPKKKKLKKTVYFYKPGEDVLEFKGKNMKAGSCLISEMRARKLIYKSCIGYLA
jgi:hypothetical protein